MNITKSFAEVWRKEARTLQNNLDADLKEAAQNNKNSLIYNFEYYSAYATMSCIMWLYEEGYAIIETNIEKVYEIRW